MPVLRKLVQSVLAGGLAVMALAGLSACSVVPSDGPDTPAVLLGGGSSGEDAVYETYPIDADVTTIVAHEHKPSLLRRLGGNRRSVAPILGPGDVIGVTVWESVDGGLFAGGVQGGRSANLQNILIDRHGMAFIPYAGRLKLGGKSVEGARRLIQGRLSRETLKPQVEIRLISDKRHRVAVTGLVGKPGLYQLNLADGSGKLIETIASAGGATGKPHRTDVKVVRGPKQGSINLGQLHSSPRYDVNLLPGDKVIITDKVRTFTVLGAVNKSSEHDFSKWNFKLVDALAIAGGLNDTRADRTGVFVFRFEHGSVANALRRRAGKPETGEVKVPVVYQLNLGQPEALFYAKAFQMQDRDTILVTNAPLHQWNKVLNAVSKAVFLARSGLAFAD
ncbi:MAG: polysaccharide biosynthesis/export family protein [Pseudomonadota bacterium]